MTPTVSRHLAERQERHENAAAKAVRKQERKQMATKPQPAFETITIAENAVIEVARAARGMNDEETFARLLVNGKWSAQVSGTVRHGYTFYSTKMGRNGDLVLDHVWGKHYKTERGALNYMKAVGKSRSTYKPRDAESEA